jgi:hypothetical protein
VAGTFWWNRKSRTIGNIVMGRGRRGGYQRLGASKGRKGRRGDGPKEDIHLMSYDDPEADYAREGRFSIDSRTSPMGSPNRRRRDS